MVRVGLCIGVMVIGMLAGPQAAPAQQQPFYEFKACDGTISSLALSEIPPADAYAVDIFDPTETALAFRDIFLAELAAAPKVAREDGNLVFSFRAESIFNGIAARSRVDPTYLGDEGISQQSPRTVEDETRELIRNDRRGRRDLGTATQQIVVEAELRNKQTQRVLWMATVRCNPITNDEPLLMKAISHAIVGHMGQAVKQQPF